MIYTLPSMFKGNDSDKNPESCYIFDYVNYNQVNNAQVVLETNAISLLTDGIKYIISPNFKVSIDKEQFVIMKMGKCLMTEHLSPNNVYSSLLVFFDNELLEKVISSYKKKNSKDTSATNEFKVGLKTPAIDTFIESIRNNKIKLTDSLIHLKTEEILHLIIQEFGTDYLNFLLEKPTPLSQIQFKLIIEANINSRISISQLAFLCNMSLSTFKRTFQRIYDTTPGIWLNDKRLETAVLKLQDINARTSDFYLDLGFETHTGFIKSFKKKFGVTPKQYQMNL